ncbi:ParA family protein [Corynebacterium variabile]|uniref:ParA family protein n=1 Tax=Corynebacterium variabile TaxID=1727 RepID=UPI00289938E2|nr:ParA family protein [Corynebacterium variabile]
MITAVANTKGGVGKTTTCIFMARAAIDSGQQALVLDADPQGSASAWTDIVRGTDGQPDWETRSVNLHQLRQFAKSPTGDDVDVFIDCPPGNPEIINAAVKAADVVIVPTQPTTIDMDRVWTTVENLGDTPCVVLLTGARLGTKLLDEAREALRDAGLPVFTTVVPLREDIRAAFGTVPTKLHGYNDVLNELKDALRG